MAKAKKPKVKTKSKKAVDKEQAKRFKETAQQLGVDETGQAFEDAFRQIVPPVKPNRKSD